MTDRKKNWAAEDNKRLIMEQAVQAAIQQSSYGSLRRVECQFDRGRLTLRGHVPSFFMKQVATELAKSAGAVGIQNHLIVV